MDSFERMRLQEEENLETRLDLYDLYQYPPLRGNFKFLELMARDRFEIVEKKFKDEINAARKLRTLSNNQPDRAEQLHSGLLT